MKKETKDSIAAAVAPKAAEAKLTADKLATEIKPQQDSGHIVLRPAAGNLVGKDQ